MLNIRAATVEDAPALAQVHVTSWRETYRGLVPDDYLASLSVAERTERWRGRLSGADPGAFTLVAEDNNGRIVGFATGGPERGGDPVYTGELYAIYLLQAAQRAGLGRRLVQAVVERLLARGHTAMLVWTLAANPSRGFYERLGGQPIRSTTITIGGADLEDVAYGWLDITGLIESGQGQ